MDQAREIAVQIGRKFCSQCCNRLDDPPKPQPCADCPSDWYDDGELTIIADVIRPHLNQKEQARMPSEIKIWPPEGEFSVGEMMFTAKPWNGPDIIKGKTLPPHISVSGLLARYLKDAMEHGHRLRVKSDGKTYEVKSCGIDVSSGASDFFLQEVGSSESK